METSATHKRFLRNTEELRERFSAPENLTPEERVKLYDATGALVGGTPLICLEYEGGRIWMKNESENGLTETHYDRCFIDLLREKELHGELRRRYHPQRHVLTEVSTGSAGVSFGAVGGGLMGFGTEIFVPPIERVRIDLTREVVDTVHEVGEGFLLETVEAFRANFEKSKASVRRDGKILKAPNHSREKVTPQAFRKIAEEVIWRIRELGGKLDAFVCAVGNGTSIRGVSDALVQEWPELQAHGFEDANGGAAYYKMRGVAVPPISGPIRMYGSGGIGKVEMPVVDGLIREGRLKTSVLIGEEQWGAEFEDWNIDKKRAETIGRTSAGALWRAKQLIREGVAEDVLTIIYDKADRYGDVWVTEEEALYLGEERWG